MPNPVVGNDRVVFVQWTDPLTGKPADANTSITITDPEGSSNIYDAFSTPTVVRDRQGSYHLVYKPDAPGTWKIHVECTAPFNGVIETEDTIDPSIMS